MLTTELLKNAINPALDLLKQTAKIEPSDEARVLLLAIAGQESDWRNRRQVGGPARSYWQFEKHGGVAGVLDHPSTRTTIRLVTVALDIPATLDVVYEAMAWNDVLAACMARLLLWTDPTPLPGVDDPGRSWFYYMRNWRPGMPHPERWGSMHRISREAVKASR